MTGSRGTLTYRVFTTLLVGCLFGCTAAGPLKSLNGEIRVLDANNRPVDPFQSADAKLTVFLFIRTDCPISNRYAPEIQRLAALYQPLGAVFKLVYPDAESAAEITRHAKEFGYTLPVFRDPHHVLVHRASVRVTPEAAVFLPDGREVYLGRIDDRYVDFGKERPAPTRRDLDEAIKSALAGEPVKVATTTAIGCYIIDAP